MAAVPDIASGALVDLLLRDGERRRAMLAIARFAEGLQAFSVFYSELEPVSHLETSDLVHNVEGVAWRVPFALSRRRAVHLEWCSMKPRQLVHRQRFGVQLLAQHGDVEL